MLARSFTISFLLQRFDSINLEVNQKNHVLIVLTKRPARKQAGL